MFVDEIATKEFYALANVPVFKDMKMGHKEEQRPLVFREVEVTIERCEERKMNVSVCYCGWLTRVTIGRRNQSIGRLYEHGLLSSLSNTALFSTQNGQVLS
jgi:hypothetical protein